MRALIVFFFFINDTATTEIYTLSLHDALPIYTIGLSIQALQTTIRTGCTARIYGWRFARSEEHTSELQPPCTLVCRLLLATTPRRPLPSEPAARRRRSTLLPPVV